MAEKFLLSEQTARLIRQSAQRRSERVGDEELDEVSSDLLEVSSEITEKLLFLGVDLEELSGKPDEVVDQRLNGTRQEFKELISEFEAIQRNKESHLARRYMGWNDDMSLEDALDSLMKALESARDVFGPDEKAEALINGVYERFDDVVSEAYTQDGHGKLEDPSTYYLSDDELDTLYDQGILRPGDIEEFYKIQQVYGADATVLQHKPSELPDAILSQKQLLENLRDGVFNEQLMVGAQMMAPLHPDLSVEDLMGGIEELVLQAVEGVEFYETKRTLETVFNQPRTALIHSLHRVVKSLFEDSDYWDPETEELNDAIKVVLVVLKLMMKRILASKHFAGLHSEQDHAHVKQILGKNLRDHQLDALKDDLRAAQPTSRDLQRAQEPKRVNPSALDQDFLKRMLEKANQLPDQDNDDEGDEEDDESWY